MLQVVEVLLTPSRLLAGNQVLASDDAYRHTIDHCIYSPSSTGREFNARNQVEHFDADRWQTHANDPAGGQEKFFGRSCRSKPELGERID